MRTFVFAIGGTGARILRSLLMMLPSDIDLENNELVPLCIDLDENNGDLARTLASLRRYRDIHEKVKSYKIFFKNNLGTLGSLAGTHERADGISDNFKLNFGNINESYYDYLNGASLEAIDKDFLELLYDDSSADNPSTELHLSLDMGFKGNPNIGCVVFNDIINSPEYKYFENIFSQGDRIFIISSIFGGTGSSGFPQLIENLNNSTNAHIKNAAIGALVVKPYFKVKDDSNSTINSDLFNSKTKAALRYYRSNLNNLSSMYYIGDKSSLPYDNIMGGAEQKNIAHVVEFLGAKSIIHFIQSSISVGQRSFFEFGIDSNPEDLQIIRSSFYRGNERFWMPFTKFVLASKIHKYLTNNYEYFETFFQKLGIRKIDLHHFNNLNAYTNDLYVWIKEMLDNRKSLNLYKLSDTPDINDFVIGKNYSLPALNDKKVLKTLIVNAKVHDDNLLAQYLYSINNLIDTHYNELLN